jgi:hypothetical protein
MEVMAVVAVVATTDTMPTIAAQQQQPQPGACICVGSGGVMGGCAGG